MSAGKYCSGLSIPYIRGSSTMIAMTRCGAVKICPQLKGKYFATPQQQQQQCG